MIEFSPKRCDLGNGSVGSSCFLTDKFSILETTKTAQASGYPQVLCFGSIVPVLRRQPGMISILGGLGDPAKSKTFSESSPQHLFHHPPGVETAFPVA